MGPVKTSPSGFSVIVIGGEQENFDASYSKKSTARSTANAVQPLGFQGKWQGKLDGKDRTKVSISGKRINLPGNYSYKILQP